jgi:hypothetical protein
MRRFVLGLFAGLAVTVATGLSSFAGYTGVGGIVVGATSGLSPNSGPLGQAFVVKDDSGDAAFMTGGNSGNSGDFASGFNFKNFFSGIYNFGSPSTIGAAGSFGSSSYGTFTGNVTVDNGVTGDNSATNRQIIFSGTFTPGADSEYGGNTTSLAALFQVTISKTGAGGGWTGAWSLDTTANAAAVPEPTSIAIFGLGAVGFAVRRFRRK